MDLFLWLKVGKLRVKWGICFDSLIFVLTVVVTFVSFWVHVYSIGYMANDVNRAKFMVYLNFFTFMMVFLLTSPTFIQLFVGWEGVGIASYLLISFWNHKLKAGLAAIKTFIVNRIGDAAILLGICVLFFKFETFDFSLINLKIPSQISQTIEFCGYNFPTLDLIGSLFLIGAMAKSAQLIFHIWLPDAMEAPTPVSALIHAATMVTAGIFLIVKLSFLYECTPLIRNFMKGIGSLTALFGAFVALTQIDIKKIIAYSTCSQLGYMMLACGCSAYDAAVFHIATHALFKALLFLSAGSVIHAMSGEQEIYKMGGLAQLIPLSYTFMWIGSLAIAGIPFFAGYYSKDFIIVNAWANAPFWCVGIALLTVFLTAFYSWRLLWVVFQGKLNADDQVVAHIHESPWVMLGPLFVLALGSSVGGWLGWRWLIKGQGSFSWQKSIVENSSLEYLHPPFWLELSTIVLSLMGIACAFFIYRKPERANNLAKNLLYQLSYHQCYFDQIYQYLFVKPLFYIGELFYCLIDIKTLDYRGLRNIGNSFVILSEKYKVIQDEYIGKYSFLMLLATVVILTLYLLRFFSFYNFKGLAFNIL